ncbi:MAG: hypothetical protein HQL39_12030, partial [Alphaproteobacteria bacterium]|nr:hypothetical protein [Alphaproteobacteria bacterium]
MLATRRHPVSIPVLLRAQSLFASGASVHEVYAALGSAMTETRAQTPTDERPDDEPRSGHILAALDQLRDMLRTHAAPQPDETLAAVPRIASRIDALEATLARRPSEPAPADLAERITSRIDALEATLASRPSEPAPVDLAERIASRIDALEATLLARPGEVGLAERIDALTSETAALPAQTAEAMAAALVGSGGGLGGDGDDWSATDALAAVVALRMLQIVERQLSRLDALTETRPEAP